MISSLYLHPHYIMIDDFKSLFTSARKSGLSINTLWKSLYIILNCYTGFNYINIPSYVKAGDQIEAASAPTLIGISLKLYNRNQRKLEKKYRKTLKQKTLGFGKVGPVTFHHFEVEKKFDSNNLSRWDSSSNVGNVLGNTYESQMLLDLEWSDFHVFTQQFKSKRPFGIVIIEEDPAGLICEGAAAKLIQQQVSPGLTYEAKENSPT